MGCLNSTSDTKVQPSNRIEENRHVQTSLQEGHGHTSQQEGHVQTSEQIGNGDTSQQEKHVQTSEQEGNGQPSEQVGHIQTSEQDGHIQTSEQDGHIQTPQKIGQVTFQQDEHLKTSKGESMISSSQQNGWIPSSQKRNTSKEIRSELSHQKEILNMNNSREDVSIQETIQDYREESKLPVTDTALSKQDIKLSKMTIHGNSETESTDERIHSSISSEGNMSQQYRERKPVEVSPVEEANPLKSHYTIQEISSHNKGKKYIDIFPFKDNVYSTAKFKSAIEHVVASKYEKFKEEGKPVAPYDYRDFNEKWKCSPIYLVMFRYRKMYIRFADIKRELPTCKVGEVSKEGDLYTDMLNNSRAILQKVYKETLLKEYKDLLEICDQASENPKSFFVTDIPKGKDPNTLEFPLPQQIKGNCKVLRKWVSNWKPFDTNIPKEGVWTELPDNVVNAMNDPLDLQDICRVSSDGLPGFDFTIEGEAAWNVIELGIVKNDMVTKEQEKIWQSRENRPGLNDPTFILRRQARLDMYFMKKYEWESPKLDSYRGFDLRLQKSLAELQELCKVDEFTVISKDEY